MPRENGQDEAEAPAMQRTLRTSADDSGNKGMQERKGKHALMLPQENPRKRPILRKRTDNFHRLRFDHRAYDRNAAPLEFR